MKLLVVGLDGGDARIIKALDMPFLQSLMQKSTRIEVDEDLWSRGWAEIVSGEHGRETGAFYAKPALDGTWNFTQRFSATEYARWPEIKPLWTLLPEMGYSIGMMNVPTSMPAAVIARGFMVSGAGAGVGGGGKVEAPLKGLQPKSIQETLLAEQYIFDTRFRQAGCREASTFFTLLGRMQQRRTDAFRALTRLFTPDFGFIAFVATTRIQYLAYRDIEALIEQQAEPKSRFQEEISILYRKLDRCVQQLLEQHEPEHVMVVSDHGAAPRRGTVNLNVFLEQVGLLCCRSAPRRAMASLHRAVNKGLAVASGGKVVRHTGQSARLNSVDLERSFAFSERYVSGIYVNDERFGGPVKGRQEAERIIEQIIAAFNNHAAAARSGLSARPYRARYAAARYAALLPDVWIDHPDELFFEAEGAFVEPNADYEPLGESLRHVSRDQYTGAKGRRPLLFVDEAAAEFVSESAPRDLSAAYHLIERVMAS